MVRLSIVIPVYNKEEYIEECLNSIFEESVDLESFEVVCVDDGSTDSSLNIIKRICEFYQNVKLILQENRGASAARNTGLRNATGEYVWFVDADDCILRGGVDAVCQSLKNNADLFTFGYVDKKILECKLPLSITESKEMTPSPYTWGNIVKRKILCDHGVLFNETITYGEDMLFWLQAGEFCNRIVKIEQPLYFYRKTSGSIMDKLKDEKYRLKQFVDLISTSKILLEDYRSTNIENQSVKIKIIDALLTYNEMVLNSRFAKNYQEAIKTVYPLPFSVRVRYLFWFKDMKRAKAIKMVFFPKLYFKQIIAKNK